MSWLQMKSGTFSDSSFLFIHSLFLFKSPSLSSMFLSLLFCCCFPPPHFFTIIICTSPTSPVSFLHCSPIYSLLSFITRVLSPSLIQDAFYLSVPTEWQTLFVTFVKARNYVQHVASLSFFLSVSPFTSDSLVPAA